MTVAPEVFPAAAWADRVTDELVAAIRANPRLRLVLPTGDTPSPVYARLVDAADRGDVSLAEATVIQLDEWVGLPPADPARCDVRLRSELLDRLADPPALVAIDVDGRPPDEAAAAHDQAVGAIDLAIVGLGANGHVGFNEPGSDAASPTRVVELDETTRRAAVERYGAGRVPHAGITLGLDRLLAARELWLLVTGEAKRDVLQRALVGPESPDCPASFLRRHPGLRVLADTPAVMAAGD